MTKRYWLGALTLIALIAVALALRVRQVARRSILALPSGDAPAPVRNLGPQQIAESAYDGKFGTGWQDWGWGPHDIGDAGPAKVVFAGYGGFVLHHAELPGNFGAVSFRYKPPSDWPEFLTVALKRSGTDDNVFPQVDVQPRHVNRLEDGWREVVVDWGELDPRNVPFDRLTIVARSSVGPEWVLLDRIALTKSSSPTVAKAPTRDVALAVMCERVSHPISPLIYGGANGDYDSGQSAQRIGGNLMTRLNWDAGDLWNTGNDWFFENGKADGNLSQWIEAGVSHSAQVALTVPMIGWVAKDASSVGFPKSKFPKQRKFDSNRPAAGDGFNPDGSKIQPGSPSATSIAAPPELIGRWIRALRDQDRARGKRSVQMYILDNEPSLWSSTHRDVHPDPVTYDELLDRTIRYATEIRKADPDAVIAGPAEWGWRGYFFSGKDQAADASLRPDRLAHGDVPLIPWYLKKLADHERTSGTRLLDVLDVHFYPAADGMYGPKARVDKEGTELRLRSTRALWDPTYRDESWIKESIRLIPRLKEWVAQNYPGLKVSIGEWSFGADEHFSGGLATAEALGRFGKENLDSAFFWNGPKAGTPTFWAFRAYRNFDGAGGRFLDISVPTRDAEKVSLFASRDEPGTHIVAVVVNRDPIFAVNVRLDLGSCGRPRSTRAFAYGPGSSKLEAIRADADDPSAPLTIQPDSFAVIDMRMQRP